MNESERFARQNDVENDFSAYFRDVAQSLPGAIFRYVLYPDGREDIEYMSPGCEAIWERSWIDVRDDPAALWAMIEPDDLHIMHGSIELSLRTLDPWMARYHIRTPSGARKCLEGRGMPTRRQDGATVWTSIVPSLGIVVASLDISSKADRHVCCHCCSLHSAIEVRCFLFFDRNP